MEENDEHEGSQVRGSEPLASCMNRSIAGSSRSGRRSRISIRRSTGRARPPRRRTIATASSTKGVRPWGSGAEAAPAGATGGGSSASGSAAVYLPKRWGRVDGKDISIIIFIINR